MASVFDRPFVPQRLQRIRERGHQNRNVDMDEDYSFARCDYTSYSYFALSMMLFGIGTIVTVLACSETDGFILSYFGHMWLVGPIFICSGLMIAVKSMLYLRRKSVIQLLLHQRAIFRELAAQQAELQAAGCILRSSSSATLPPSYEALVPIPISPSPGGEVPPPSYEEAMCLLLGDTSTKPETNTNGIIIKPYTDVVLTMQPAYRNSDSTENDDTSPQRQTVIPLNNESIIKP